MISIFTDQFQYFHLLAKCLKKSSRFNYLEYSLLTNCQHGVRQNSTETIILRYVNNVFRFLEENGYVVGVYIDLFYLLFDDSLNYKMLLDKMKHIGKRGIPLRYVYCNKTFSKFMSTSGGVPLGPVLGLILFLMYIIEGEMLDQNLTILLADDTSLLLTKM